MTLQLRLLTFAMKYDYAAKAQVSKRVYLANHIKFALAAVTCMASLHPFIWCSGTNAWDKRCNIVCSSVMCPAKDILVFFVAHNIVLAL